MKEPCASRTRHRYRCGRSRVFDCASGQGRGESEAPGGWNWKHCRKFGHASPFRSLYSLRIRRDTHRSSIQDLHAGSRLRPGPDCMSNPLEVLQAGLSRQTPFPLHRRDFPLDTVPFNGRPRPVEMFTYHPTPGAGCLQDATRCGERSNFLPLGQRTPAGGAEVHAGLDEQACFAIRPLRLYEFDPSVLAHMESSQRHQ
jgi:hypothetical protein